jgi:hypothetical protein
MGRCLESFIEPCVVPWFAEAARSSWRDLRPTVVLVPNQVYANRVRAHLAAQEVPALNVRFWTLPELRRHLATVAGVRGPIEDQDDRILILRAAALATQAADETNEAAGAVAGSPGSLLETSELLSEGGWSGEEIEAPPVRAILARQDELFGRIGRERPAAFAFSLTLAQVHGALRSVLIAGFDAGHFGEWASLRLAVWAADDTLALLHTPRQKAEGLDFAWLASWEQLGGSVEPVGEDDPAGAPLLAAAFDELPMASGAQPEANRVSFALTATVAEEADNACATAARALADGARRIALVVPQPGYLAREIAGRLDRLGLPYYDGLAGSAEDALSSGRWRKLLGVFEEQSVPRLLELLAEPGCDPGLPGGNDRLRRAIERAAEPFLFTDLGLFAAYLTDEVPEIAAFVRQLAAPATATIGAFLAVLETAATVIGWESGARQVRRLAIEKQDLGNLVTDRRGLRQWLEPHLLSLEKRRSLAGSNPYACIQLVRPDMVNGLAWDLVCYTGQNEGVWPPPLRACPYLGDDALRVLNEQVCRLNGHALEPTERDEPTGVRAGRALCLSPGLRRALVLRDFANSLELSAHVAMSAAERDAAQPGAVLYPGQIFTRLQQLLNQNAEAVVGARGRLPEAAARMPMNTEGIEVMLHAWQERRNPVAAFGEYEFCLKSRPDWGPAVPSSSWEAVFSNPAAVFLRTFLGVAPARNLAEELPWKKVAGIWVHDWLHRAVGGEPRRIADLGSWRELVEAEGMRHRDRIERVLAGAGRALPAWWTSLWEQARVRGRQFADSLEAAREYVFAQAEVVIPEVEIVLPSGRRLPVFGQADLVLTDRLPEAPDDYRHCRAWIIDYKTGKARPLQAEALRRGEGVQLPQYGLALEALGAAAADLTLLRPGAPLDPQLSVADVRREIGIFELFAWMLETGTFGRLEPMRPEFGAGPEFPLACLETGTDLQAKWRASLQGAPLPS